MKSGLDTAAQVETEASKPATYSTTESLLIQPAFHLAPILAEHGWLFITLVEAKRTARFEATACWQIDQTGRLARDEHRV